MHRKLTKKTALRNEINSTKHTVNKKYRPQRYTQTTRKELQVHYTVTGYNGKGRACQQRKR